MIGAIPNPTKKLVIEFPMSQVSDAVKKIPLLQKKYRLDKENPIFNQTTLSALEFLSLGVFVDITLTPISENRTEIFIEVRRKLGAFDTWVEVQNANKHIQVIMDSLSTLIASPNIEVSEIKPAEAEDSLVPIIIGIIIGLAILAAML